MKHNGFDVYDIILEDNDIGIKATSLVTLPAIESNFLHFNKDKPQFIFASEEKQELIGAIMIPDKLIYRNINNHKFYVNFTADVIRDLTSKMLTSGTAGLFTIQHKHKVDSESVNVQEVWIKETENDKSVDFGIEEAIGTAFMKVKVNNTVIWNQIKKNGLNGFSIELDASIVEKNELLFNKQENKMSIKDVFKNSIEVKGVALHFNSDLKENSYLVTENEDGTPSAYTGEFNHENIIYKVKDGVVFESVDAELSTREAIEGLSTGFSALKETVEGILLSKQAIDDKQAELDLLKTQFNSDKVAFAKLKEKGISKVEVSLSKSMSEFGETGANWLKKFK